MPAPDLSLLADRRALEAGGAAADRPALAPRVPVGVEKTLGRAPDAVHVPRRPALTAREERVREMLLRELKGLNKTLKLEKTWAEKKERDGLARLDVAFLDREISKMRRQTAQAWHVLVLLAMPVVLLGVVFALASRDADFNPWVAGLTFCATVATSIYAAVQQRDALRRKLFIYEALRALSEADELDVVLDRATRDADALIERIVARELAAERRHPVLPPVEVTETQFEVSRRLRQRAR